MADFLQKSENICNSEYWFFLYLKKGILLAGKKYYRFILMRIF